jgi:hypothetical protein
LKREAVGASTGRVFIVQEAALSAAVDQRFPYTVSWDYTPKPNYELGLG